MTASPARCPEQPWERVGVSLRAHWAPASFVGSCLLYAALSLAVRIAPFHPLGIVDYFDLRVYRASAGIVVLGHPLYGARFAKDLAFTYPPFAALVLVALRPLPIGGDELVVTALNLVLLVAIARLALSLPRSGGRPMAPDRRARIAWVAAAIGLWTEPVNTAIGYGQIDLLIAALVLLDLSRPAGARGRGAAIGLAAGLKLTPLIFIPYLLLCGRRREAVTATLVFVATILAGVAVLPADSRVYWTGTFLDTSRVSGRRHAGAGPANQSLRGALLRLLPHLRHPQALWLAVAVIVACVGLTLAARAARRGDGARGFVLTAVTGLLVSPISWTHQWTLALPGLLLFVVGASSPRRTWLRAGGALAFAASSYAIWIVIGEHQLGRHLDAFDLVAGDLYVLAGLGGLLAAAALELAPAPGPATATATA